MVFLWRQLSGATQQKVQFSGLVENLVERGPHKMSSKELTLEDGLEEHEGVNSVVEVSFVETVIGARVWGWHPVEQGRMKQTA
jgi:hypothetical protein